MRNNYHSRITALYADIRAEEQKNLRARREEIGRRIPRIPEIENEIGRVSLEIALLHVRNPENWEGKFKLLKDRSWSLRGEKVELLVEHGFPMDYLELKHHCRKCNDTGFIGTTKCACYQKKLAELVYADSEFSTLLDEYSFEKYDERVFDDTTALKSSGKTARQNMADNLKVALKYAADFPIHHENLYFYGHSGTGKTFLATCIARELLYEGNVVVYRTASQLMDDIKEIRFKDNKELGELLLNSDLLIIDDLGTEMQSDLAKTEIFNVVNGRLLNNRKILISTNLSFEELKEKYSERLFSRIMGEFILVPFLGDDLRIKQGFLRRKKFSENL